MNKNNILHKPKSNRCHPVIDLHSDINDLFSDFFNFHNKPLNKYSACESLPPAVEVIEGEKLFKINIEIPGVKKEDIDVAIQDHNVSVKCNRKKSVNNEGENYLIKETYCGCFERSINVPKVADTDTARAEFENGILSILIDKKSESIKNKRTLKIQ